MNKTDKLPVSRALTFQWKMANTTKKRRKTDMMTLLRKMRQGREKGKIGRGGSSLQTELRR